MLQTANSARLTRPELERWSRITGFEPVGVRTVDDLRRYVARCKQHYWGASDETRFLHWLIDEEVTRCVGQSMAEA
jgi:hypothetical protein